MADGVGFETEILPALFVVARMGCWAFGNSFVFADIDLNGNER